MLRNCKGEVLFMFSKNVGICDLNEAKVLAILKGLRLFARRYIGALVGKIDSSNAITWYLTKKIFLGKFNSLLMKLGSFRLL